MKTKWFVKIFLFSFVVANILMVLCGHTGSSTWRNERGANGNRIYQILQDYQGENTGDGYKRLLEINPEKKTISGKIYFPYSKKEKKADLVLKCKFHNAI